ncbi:MAG: hypothetical protein JW934_04470 [Anaerolineae bacterium]|nr:hypothetical protein [Anaerolineae bacterium]
MRKQILTHSVIVAFMRARCLAYRADTHKHPESDTDIHRDAYPHACAARPGRAPETAG